MATRQKEKTAKHHEEKDKRPTAILRYVRIAPRKVRTVIDLIRGKKVAEAEAILAFTPKAASPVVAKLLKSAVANAENNLEMSKDNLFIAEIFADQGPTLKRFQPRAHGRAFRINKKSSHITIILEQVK
ncbi:MAG: 50S ribosomal protein L22 [Bacillota bacterium]|nr:50S ribosomal protein L22 [Bacillota bacterium]